MQVGHTDRLLAAMRSTEDRPLMIRQLPMDQALPVPPGGDVHISPDGWIVTDANGDPQSFIGSNGVLVYRGSRANGDEPKT
jgi:hypothetical protein